MEKRETQLARNLHRCFIFYDKNGPLHHNEREQNNTLPCHQKPSQFSHRLHKNCSARINLRETIESSERLLSGNAMPTLYARLIFTVKLPPIVPYNLFTNMLPVRLPRNIAFLQIKIDNIYLTINV